MKRTIYLLLMIVFLIGCQKSTVIKKELEFRYIEDLCCGNLMLINDQTIENYPATRLDSLTYGVNLKDYINAQNLEFGDELLIEFEILVLPLSDEYEINCTVICNRHSGIPIKILSLERL